MKRITIVLGVILILGLVIGVLGCTTKSSSTTHPSPASPSSPATSSDQSEEVITWRWQNCISSGPEIGVYPYTGGDAMTRQFLDVLKEYTKGRLVIEYLDAGAVVGPNDAFQAVSTGMIDVAGHGGPEYHAGITPESAIMQGLPFAWETPQEAFDALYRRGLIDIIEEVYAEHNIYPIPVCIGQIYGIGSIDPIYTPADVKGKKIRAVGGYGRYIEALGGSPTQIPFADLYMSLKLGTIDGEVFGLDGVTSLKHTEVVNYYITKPNLNTVVSYNLINMDSWNSLPDDIRDFIKLTARYIIWSGAEETRFIGDTLLLPPALAGGFTLVEWSAEDIAAVRKMAIDTLWQEAADASPRCAQMVELVKDQMKAISKF